MPQAPADGKTYGVAQRMRLVRTRTRSYNMYIYIYVAHMREDLTCPPNEWFHVGYFGKLGSEVLVLTRLQVWPKRIPYNGETVAGVIQSTTKPTRDGAASVF